MWYVDGTQSIWAHIQWVKNAKKVLCGMTITTGAAQYTMIQQLANGNILTTFKECIHSLQEEAWKAWATIAREALALGAAEAQADFFNQRTQTYCADIYG
jgi:hypothetical protein